MKSTSRRKRRKNPSGTGKYTGKRAVQAIAAGAAIAAGTQAYASPIRFDNPAHGEPGYFYWPTSTSARFLDLTLDAASQPGSMGPTSLFHWPAAYGAVSGAEQGPEVCKDASGYVLVPFASGELISGAGNWEDFAYVDFPGHPALLPEGQQTYLGVSIQDNGTHYGWIGVVRTGMELDAFAWGYETEPGVSIPAGAPEPGTLAMLACGAIAVMRRRR